MNRRSFFAGLLATIGASRLIPKTLSLRFRQPAVSTLAYPPYTPYTDRRGRHWRTKWTGWKAAEGEARLAAQWIALPVGPDGNLYAGSRRCPYVNVARFPHESSESARIGAYRQLLRLIDNATDKQLIERAA